MFGKKKEMVGSFATSGVTSNVDAKLPVTKVEASSKLKAEKLPAPRQIPGIVGKHLVAEYNMDTALLQILKSVVRKKPQAERAFDCRIYDPAEAEAKEIRIQDYTSLDGNSDLILYEGWFDEETKHVEMAEKRKISLNVTLFTKTEIQHKIEALSEPGSSVYFYQAVGRGFGGPLGRGAAVIELNPNHPKKGKKYNIYTTNVIGTEPSTKHSKLYESDKPKEISDWVVQGHRKRMY